MYLPVVKKKSMMLCVAVFGAVSLNLSDTIIKEDIAVECVTVFIGIDIKFI